MKKAAAFRGGECLEEKAPADIYTPIKWKCADGHEFMMSVNAVLQGGHGARNVWHMSGSMEISQK